MSNKKNTHPCIWILFNYKYELIAWINYKTKPFPRTHLTIQFKTIHMIIKLKHWTFYLQSFTFFALLIYNSTIFPSHSNLVKQHWGYGLVSSTGPKSLHGTPFNGQDWNSADPSFPQIIFSHLSGCLCSPGSKMRFSLIVHFPGFSGKKEIFFQYIKSS